MRRVIAYHSEQKVFLTFRVLVNIYSHVVGAFVFLTTPIYSYQALYILYPLATRADIIVFSIFFYGVSICFILSAT